MSIYQYSVIMNEKNLKTINNSLAGVGKKRLREFKEEIHFIVGMTEGSEPPPTRTFKEGMILRFDIETKESRMNSPFEPEITILDLESAGFSRKNGGFMSNGNLRIYLNALRDGSGMFDGFLSEGGEQIKTKEDLEKLISQENNHEEPRAHNQSKSLRHDNEFRETYIGGPVSRKRLELSIGTLYDGELVLSCEGTELTGMEADLVFVASSSDPEVTKIQRKILQEIVDKVNS